MTWRDLLPKNEEFVGPWIGGRIVQMPDRLWWLTEPLTVHGWYKFRDVNGKALPIERTEPNHEILTQVAYGYLVGDRFASEKYTMATRVEPDKVYTWPRVNLIEDGLDRFVRVSVGKVHGDGPLIYRCQEMPLGVEDAVIAAYQDRVASLSAIKGVTPALDAAFRMASWQRLDTERRRLELEQRRREEEAKRAAEEKRQALVKQLGDGAGRRALAKIDFETAARAALRVGNAELLDYRKAHGEHVVTYRLNGRRLQCTCDDELRICSAGICLVDHTTGRADDDLLTLESLPGVVAQAEREGRLVVFRHV
jgi:hypothetical protein